MKTVTRADLHVHSRYSELPTEWLLHKLGAGESYTEPETIYQVAKERGMSFVTITDHNRLEGALLLTERHPEDTFTGVELTASFPEDGPRVHLLVYGLSEPEFRETQRLRLDLFALREYLLERRLAHSLAHATFPVDGDISLEHLEKLLLLFNVFEGRNGGRSRSHNAVWSEMVRQLTPERMEDLYRKHRIAPAGPHPWRKGLTGGSDDHAGLFIGRTYAQAEAATPSEFLEQLRVGATEAGGRHNDFQGLAFTVFKIAYDYSKTRPERVATTPWNQAAAILFEHKRLSHGKRFKLGIARLLLGRRAGLQADLIRLVRDLDRQRRAPIDEKVNMVFGRMADLTDAFVITLAKTLEEDVRAGDVFQVLRCITSMLPGVLFSVPFLSTLRHLSRGRELLEQIERELPAEPRPIRRRRSLWFLDTPDDAPIDLDVLHRWGQINHRRVGLASCMPPSPAFSTHGIAALHLPQIYRIDSAHTAGRSLRFPSLLNGLSQIYRFEPDEIFIGTSGPVGALGLLAGRILNTRTVGVPNPAFGRIWLDFLGEDFSELLSDYSQTFYALAGETRPPQNG